MKARAGFQHGFTIIEILLVIVIMGVLLTIAAPSFVTFTAAQKVKTASFELYATMAFARSEAIKRRADVTITALDNDWKNGWSVTTPDPLSAGTLTLRTQQPLSGIVTTMTWGTGPTTSTLPLVFGVSGRLSIAGGSPPANVLIQPQSGDLSAVNPNRCIKINFTGMPKTTATDGTTCT